MSHILPEKLSDFNRSLTESIIAVGLNHKTAPIQLREQLAFRNTSLVEVAQELRSRCDLNECAIISTCNRAEFYAVSGQHGTSSLFDALAHIRHVDRRELQSHSYEHHDTEAVWHLCRVASGLDSMVVGENQVLKQVKDASEVAAAAGTSGPILSALFRQAVTAGKRARTETPINRGAVSISHAAVELARQIFGELSGCRALVLGAGEMSEITLKLLRNAGMKTSIMISNRTRERAEALALRCDGIGVEWDRLPEALAEADIVIVSTSAPHHILRRDMVAAVMKQRRGKRVFLIDISVPRNVEPEAGELPDVFLYNVDDLQDVVARNLGDRKSEVEKVESIIAEEVARFEQWRHSRYAVPAIVGLRQHAEDIRQVEWDHFAGRLAHLSEKDLRTVEALSRQITQRILQEPLRYLKSPLSASDAFDPVEAVQSLFNLSLQTKGSEQSPGAAPVEDSNTASEVRRGIVMLPAGEGEVLQGTFHVNGDPLPHLTEPVGNEPDRDDPVSQAVRSSEAPPW